MRAPLLGLAVWAVATIGMLAQGLNPFLGTWQLNVAKSTYSPGPAPKNLTLIYEPAGSGLKASTQQINADGTKSGLSYTANLDGKEYPVTGWNDWDSVSLKRVDPLTIEHTRKKAGKVVNTATVTVSKAGRMLTVRAKGVNAKGHPVNDVLIYEK